MSVTRIESQNMKLKWWDETAYQFKPVHMTACGLFTEGTTLGSVARKCFEERKIPIHLTEVNGHIKSGLKMETVLFQLNGSQFCGELCQFNTFVAKKKTIYFKCTEAKYSPPPQQPIMCIGIRNYNCTAPIKRLSRNMQAIRDGWTSLFGSVGNWWLRIHSVKLHRLRPRPLK